MTWLEKFKQDHPTLADKYIMSQYCPDDGLVSNCPLFDGEVDCKRCWMRQVETDEEITVAGPVYEPNADGGLTVEGPDRT